MGLKSVEIQITIINESPCIFLCFLFHESFFAFLKGDEEIKCPGEAEAEAEVVINDPLGQTTVIFVIFAWFWSFGTDGRTDGQTLCVKILITTGRNCGRPRGSIKMVSFFPDFFRNRTWIEISIKNKICEYLIQENGKGLAWINLQKKTCVSITQVAHSLLIQTGWWI